MRARARESGPDRASRGRIAALTAVLLLVGWAAVPPLHAGQAGVRQAQVDSAATGRIEPHPEAQEAVSRLKSPFCPGLMLEVCPSPQASALRDTIRGMAERGADADSLISWMLARYGEEYRAVPETQGSGLLAWIVPPLALLLGGGLVFLVLRRIRDDGPGRIDAEAVRNLSPEDEERLSEALSEMEREGR